MVSNWLAAWEGRGERSDSDSADTIPIKAGLFLDGFEFKAVVIGRGGTTLTGAQACARVVAEINVKMKRILACKFGHNRDA